MSSTELTWRKCEGDVWCSFQNLNLDSVGEETEGVFSYSMKQFSIPRRSWLTRVR